MSGNCGTPLWYFEATTGVQLYTYQKRDKKGKLRCGINVSRIQSQANCEYFDHRSPKRVPKDTFFYVFRPLLDQFLPNWRKEIATSGLRGKPGIVIRQTPVRFKGFATPNQLQHWLKENSDILINVCQFVILAFFMRFEL